MTSLSPSLTGAAGAAALPAVLALGAGLLAGLPLSTAGPAAMAGAGAVALAFYRHATRPFGLANTVTTARLVLALLLLTLLVPASATDRDAWLAASLAGTAVLLDGVDGWIARRLRQESPFGARLDMETDAVLMIVIAMVLAVSGRAGPWILLAGLWRPLFVMAGRAVPWLRRPLPPSWRRKACCASPIVLMTCALAPVVSAFWSEMLAGLALGLLSLSFTLDILWLLGQRARALP